MHKVQKINIKSDLNHFPDTSQLNGLTVSASVSVWVQCRSWQKFVELHIPQTNQQAQIKLQTTHDNK
jgi:hypothetical protein